MKIENYQMSIIRADEGKWLTQKNEDISVKERIFAKTIYQAVDSTDEYAECNDEYKEYIESKKKELMEKEMNEALNESK
jgi:pantothenate synthetase